MGHKQRGEKLRETDTERPNVGFCREILQNGCCNNKLRKTIFKVLSNVTMTMIQQMWNQNRERKAAKNIEI